MLKRNWALIWLVYLAFAEALSWSPVPDLSLCLIQPEHNEQYSDHNGNKYCPAFHTGITAGLDAIDGFLERHDKSVVGGFTIVLAISTIGLWLATIALYRAGERQLDHIRGESEAADFHRTSQFEQIAQQIEALKASAEAAENQVSETRELVWNSHLNAQRQLRAYVIVDTMDVVFQDHESGGILVVFQIFIKNTGQTPAHDVRVISKTELLAHPIRMPFDFLLEGPSEPSVGLLGSAEITETHSYPEKSFDDNEMMVARNRESGARIYTWGTITYRDVFNTPQHTNFCISLIFYDDGECAGVTSEHHNDAS